MQSTTGSPVHTGIDPNFMMGFIPQWVGSPVHTGIDPSDDLRNMVCEKGFPRTHGDRPYTGEMFHGIKVPPYTRG